MSPITPPCTVTRAPRPIVTWSASPAWPARKTSSSTWVLPAIPAWPAMRQRAPMRQLCPICTRLSILVPWPTTVSSTLPRSIVVLAPITSSIDRGSVDATVVGQGTKIDNLVQIGHNCRIGARCLIAGQAGIAGSTHVEDDVFLAGQAGLADHVTIGRGARVTVQGGVIGDIAPGATVSGYPARTHREFLRAQGALYRLAHIVDDLEALGRRTDEAQR